MSFRNTAILLIVLVVLGGVVVFINRQGLAETDSDATPTPAPLTSLAADDVQSIMVEQGDQSITVERQDDGWVIAGDSPEPAGTTKVEQALNRLTSLKPTRTLEDVQPSDFGLGEPAWTITLTPADGDPVVYRVGDENPRSTGRYVQVGDEPAVYLVSKSNVEDVQAWLETPPYPPTPTPEPTATPEAETPAAEATVMPEVTATPEVETPAAEPTAPPEATPTPSS